MNDINIITQRLDSIAAKLDLLYTSSPDFGNHNFLGHDFGWISVLSLVIAIGALGFGAWGTLSQRETQKNTSNMTSANIEFKLFDLIRHFYRNLVVTCAMETKLNKYYKDQKGHYTGYPSEEHFLKLAPPRDWMKMVNHQELNKILGSERDNKGKETLVTLANLEVLFRNYEIEFQVACNHFKDKSLATVVKQRDLSTLKLKAWVLAKNIYYVLIHYRKATHGIDYDTTNQEVQYYVMKHRKYIDTQAEKKPEKLAHYNEKDLKFFAEILFENDEKFINDFNDDVNIECGKNGDGSDKIFIISY